MIFRSAVLALLSIAITYPADAQNNPEVRSGGFLVEVIKSSSTKIEDLDSIFRSRGEGRIVPEFGVIDFRSTANEVGAPGANVHSGQAFYIARQSGVHSFRIRIDRNAGMFVECVSSIRLNGKTVFRGKVIPDYKTFSTISGNVELTGGTYRIEYIVGCEYNNQGDHRYIVEVRTPADDNFRKLSAAEIFYIRQ